MKERLIDDRGSSERNADRSLSSVGHTHTHEHTHTRTRSPVESRCRRHYHLCIKASNITTDVYIY